MKKTLIGVIDLKPELKCEQAVIVEYSRIEDEVGDEGYERLRPFGIEVVKKQKIDDIIYREVKMVRNLSESADKADRLLMLLCKNSVTPICVSDVLEDLRTESLMTVYSNKEMSAS